jgi:hypothetical protein
MWGHGLAQNTLTVVYKINKLLKLLSKLVILLPHPELNPSFTKPKREPYLSNRKPNKECN